MALLDKVKVACRIASNAYDDELTDLIAAAIADIGITDVTNLDEDDPLIRQAVLTYCRINHPYDGMDDGTMRRLRESYDEQKSQLLMSSGYTEWGESDA